MKIAITAVGGGVGQSIIKALLFAKYTTVGIDPNPRAAGLYMADVGYLGKNINDKGFIQRIIEVCHKEKCKYLFPGLDAELGVFASNFLKLKEQGVMPIVSDPIVIEISDNKMILSRFLKENNFPYIKTVRTIQEAESIGIEPPVIVKPMVGGCRSKDVMVCNNFKAVDDFIAGRENQFIIQENIEGDEYTCGSVTFNKTVLGHIVMKRELRAGDTYKAYVVNDENIQHFLDRLLPVINPFGPCNIQMRVRDNVPYVFEINARCSGTTAARALVGFNEPEMCCNYLEGKKVKKPIIQEKAIFRYWDECVVGINSVEELSNEGSINWGKWSHRKKI